MNKTLGYFGLMSSAQDKNTEKNKKIEKRKFNTAMEVLHEVSVTFSETKKRIDGKLDRKKCSKKSMYVEEVIYFS